MGIIVFNKPYGVLSQFSENGSDYSTLSEYNFPPSYYPVGRLDADSEGLLLLSDEAIVTTRIAHPASRIPKTYWAQVEGAITQDDIAVLAAGGIAINSYSTLPCIASIVTPQPILSPRTPPIRIRKNSIETWIELTITEGKNRQVRKMTAAIGFPTLRLIRIAIGELQLATCSLEIGTWKRLPVEDYQLLFGIDSIDHTTVLRTNKRKKNNHIKSTKQSSTKNRLKTLKSFQRKNNRKK